MKRILMVLAQLAVFSCILGACDKDDDNTLPEGTLSYRVKSVSGSNSLWGEYKMVYGYTGNRLDSIVWRDALGIKTRMLEIRYNVNKIVAELDDIVCKVSADSAAKLHPDSIPYTWQVALKIEHTTDRQGRLLDEYIRYKAPRKQMEGEEFTYVYEQTGEVKFLYEYDETGRLAAWRSPFYGENREMVKNEYVWNGERIDEGKYTVYDLSRWSDAGSESFTYNGDLLTGWQTTLTFPDKEGQETKAEYTYSGRQLQKIIFSVKENSVWTKSREMTYTFDAEGRVTKIDYGNGEWESIEYENSPGNFDYFLLKANAPYRIPDVLGHLRTVAFAPVTGK